MIICSKEESWERMYQKVEEMEQFLNNFQIKFQVKKEVSSRLPKESSFLFVFEAFLPSKNCFEEIAFVSNTTDYCSRYLCSRLMQKHMGNSFKPFVHFIFSNLFLQKLSFVVLEQFSTENSFHVPFVLHPFSKNQTVIAFNK